MKQEPSPLAALVVGAIVVAAFILAYRSFSRRRKSGNNAGVLKPDTKITIGKVPEDETVVSLNKAEDEEQLRPSELYSKAMEKLSKGSSTEAREIFNNLVDSHPDAEESQRAKLHILKMIQSTPNRMPPWLFAIPVIIGFKIRENSRLFEQLFDALLIGSGILVIYWAWTSWENFSIDDAESKVAKASGWLWLIAIINLLFGLVVKFGIYKPPYPIDWKYQILFGIGFLVVAAIVSKTRNGLTLVALVLAIAAWGGDTILIAGDIILSNLSVKPFIYVMIVFHVVILNSIVGALGGLNGLFKLHSPHSVNYENAEDSDEDNEENRNYISEMTARYSAMTEGELAQLSPSNLTKKARECYEQEIQRRQRRK